MIPNHKERNVQTSGLDEQAVFGISVDNQAHIMTILRDTLYTDKILAVLREYSANAWDSHRMSGKDNLPIKVILPSPAEPTLSIRDFGPGLTQEEVFTVFTQYGASTKRNTDKAVGTLGIGCKSGFAYSDSFSIDSYNNGTKSTYVAVLDKSEKGQMTLLNREPCGEETGLCIQIPVKPEDIPQFIDKAKGLFRYFIPKPDINTEIADMAEIAKEMKTGVLTNSGGWVAVMGCIPYRINIEQLQAIRNKEEDTASIKKFLSGLSGLLFFKIGEIHIVANREELRYTSETKTALVNRFNDLIEEYVTSALKDIQDSGLTYFERRMRLMKFEALKFAIPDVLKELLNPNIELKGCKDFSFHRTNYRYEKKLISDSIDEIHIDDDTTFVLNDDPRSISGFKFGDSRPYLVKIKPMEDKKRKGRDWATLMPKFEKFLEENKISGVKLLKLSEFPWEAPKSNRKRYEANEKHKVTTFKFDPEANGRGSDLWEVKNHTPSIDDVFVVLEKFKTYRKATYSDHKMYIFRDKYRETADWLKFFGEKMPAVYGYKSTKKNPVDVSKLLGTEFITWAEKRKKDLTDKAETNPVVMRMAETVALENLNASVYHNTGNYRFASEELVKALPIELGEKHPLVTFLVPYMEAEMKKKESYSSFTIMESFIEESAGLRKLKERAFKAFTKRLKSIVAPYPLLKEGTGGISNLMNEQYKHWVHYVKLIDKEHTDGRTKVHTHKRVVDACLGGQDAHSPRLPTELRSPPTGVDGEELGQGSQLPDGQQSAGGMGAG